MKKHALSIVLFCLLLFSGKSYATHLLGGEITWECVNTGSDKGKLIFTIIVYTPCYAGGDFCGGSMNISNPLYALYGGVALIPCFQVRTADLTTPCYDSAQQSYCHDPLGPNVGKAMKECVYVSLPTQINGIPDVNGSDFWFSSSSRTTMLNTFGYDFFLRTTMYPYTDSNTNTTLKLGTPALGPSCYDSAPIFAESVVPISCAGSFTTLPSGCYDTDGDSLVYDWDTPMQSAINPIIWLSNYSATSPFPGTLHNSGNVPATLNNATGQIIFKSMPLHVPGYHQYCVKVSSYRKGQKIAEVYREAAHIIDSCLLPSISNTLPVVELKDAGKPNYKTMLDTAIEVGSTIELDFRSTDFDTLPTSNPTNLQSVDLEVIGTAMSSVPNDTLTCVDKPCAYMDTIGNSSWNATLYRFVDSGQVVARFKWQTDCSMLFPVSSYNGQPVSRQFTFIMRTSDNYCPNPGKSSLQFRITVYDSTSIPQPLVEIDASSGGAKLTWNQYSNPNFTSYNVFRSINGAGPWALIHNSGVSGAVTYHDQVARTDSIAHFYMLKVNNSICMETGYEARSINLKGRQEQNGDVLLNWNKPQYDPNVTGQYGVYRKYDNGSWVQIATKNSFNLTAHRDADPFVARYNFYKIEITDSKGLNSISNVIEVERDTPSYITPVIPPKIVDDVRFLPNPFRNELILIDQSGELLGETIVFYNVLGDRLYEYRVQETNSKIDLKELKQGIYFVHYIDINGKVGSKRLVKME